MIKPCGDLTDGVQTEIRILEETKQGKIDSYGNDETQLPSSGVIPPQEPSPRQVADGRRKCHERAKLIVPEAVEYVAGDGQPYVPLALATEPPINKIADWQKAKDEG